MTRGLSLGSAAATQRSNILITFEEHEGGAKFIVLRLERTRQCNSTPVVWKQGIEIGLGRMEAVIGALEQALSEARARGYFDDYKPRLSVILTSATNGDAP